GRGVWNPVPGGQHAGDGGRHAGRRAVRRRHAYRQLPFRADRPADVRRRRSGRQPARRSGTRSWLDHGARYSRTGGKFGGMKLPLDLDRSSAQEVRIPVREPDGSTVTLVADQMPGEGRPILLLHAIGLARISWEWVLPRIAPFGPAWAFDLLGFGESDKPAHA